MSIQVAGHTELCPLKTFAGEPIYQSETPTEQDVKERLKKYYWPYHHKLQQWISKTRNKFGLAIVYEAHSIKSRVPRLFDGILPDLNLGTFDGRSCHAELEELVWENMQASNYAQARNERFKGGYITRFYGQPGKNVFTLQMEIAQHCYLDESTRKIDGEKFAQLQEFLHGLTENIISWGNTYGKV